MGAMYTESIMTNAFVAVTLANQAEVQANKRAALPVQSHLEKLLTPVL